MQRRHLSFTPVEELKKTTDFTYVYFIHLTDKQTYINCWSYRGIVNKKNWHCIAFERFVNILWAWNQLNTYTRYILQSICLVLSSNSATEDQRKNEFPCSIFRHRIPKDQWWLKLRPLLRILTKHKEKAYTPEGIFAGVDDFEDEDNI